MCFFKNVIVFTNLSGMVRVVFLSPSSRTYLPVFSPVSVVVEPSLAGDVNYLPFKCAPLVTR